MVQEQDKNADELAELHRAEVRACWYFYRICLITTDYRPSSQSYRRERKIWRKKSAKSARKRKRLKGKPRC